MYVSGAVSKCIVRNRHKKESALSKDLAQRKAVLDSEGYQAWVAARTAKDFSMFAPTLQAWIDLNQEMCAAIDPSKPVYDVALDDYEKGMTTARLDEIFEVRALSNSLVSIPDPGLM